MGDIWLKWQKRMGAIAFLAVVGIVMFNVLFFRDESIPATATGCYRSESAPDIVVRSDGLDIDQTDVAATKATYRKDNVGEAILTARPLILKPGMDGRYKFSDDRTGRYIRPESTGVLTIDASDGTTISYHRVDCSVSKTKVVPPLRS